MIALALRRFALRNDAGYGILTNGFENGYN